MDLVLQHLALGKLRITPRVDPNNQRCEFGDIINNKGDRVINFVFCHACKKIFRKNNVAHIQKVENKSEMLYNLDEKRNFAEICINMIAKDCMPLGITSEIEFRRFAKKLVDLGAKYGAQFELDRVLPDKKGMAKYLKLIARRKRDVISMQILSAIQEKSCSVAIHTWRDKNDKRTLLCAVFHYFQDHRQKEICLGIRVMLQDIPEELEFHLVDIFRVYGINFKEINIILIMSANSKLLGIKPKDPKIICSYSILQKILNIAMKKSTKLMKVFDDIVDILKRLRGLSILEKMPKIDDVHESKWRIMVQLFDFILRNWDGLLEITTSNEAQYKIIISNRKTFELMAGFGNYLQTISDKLEDTKFISLPFVIPAIKRLKFACQISNMDNAVAIEYKKNILNGIEELWVPKLNIYHSAAEFLYPLSKHENNATAKKFCRDKILKQLPNSKVKRRPFPLDLDFFFPRDSKPEILSNVSLITNEIERYFLHVIDPNLEFEVVQWWNEHRKEYPNLAKFALKLITIPPSTTGAQRMAKLSRNLCIDDYDDISNIEDLLFLNSVLKDTC